MQNVNYELELRELLEHAKGKMINVAAKVFEIISDYSDPVPPLEWFYQNIKEIKSTKENEVEAVISREQFEALRQSLDTMVVGILDNLLLEYLPEREFYEELWKRVFSNDMLFTTREQKVYALFRIWVDQRIPYCQIDAGMKMEDTEYREIIADKNYEIQKAIFITYSKFEQRTQSSSQFLKILEECESDREKAVLLSLILSMAEDKAQSEILGKAKDVLENKDE